MTISWSAFPECITAAHLPEGWKAMFTGKLPTGICRPAGLSDHWFGSWMNPFACTPGNTRPGGESLFPMDAIATANSAVQNVRCMTASFDVRELLTVEAGARR